MDRAMAALAHFDVRTGDLKRDVIALLEQRACHRTLDHTTRVARLCQQLAGRWGQDQTAATAAGWLHDVSAVVPTAERISLAEALGLEILPEERIAPLILHQKLSVAIARELFDVTDAAILGAIGCHTTLRRDASVLGTILFVADKLEWDLDGEPPYRAELAAAARRSLCEAAGYNLDYLWQRRETLPAVHPWLIDAYWQHVVDTSRAGPPRPCQRCAATDMGAPRGSR